MNAMDFDDLLFQCVQLLEVHTETREKYEHNFRHVLVDEYQDTNRAQYRWLQLLTGHHRNLCVVGDDGQSIYSFRSADIRNILDFERDFSDAHVVKLEQNYRSTQTILDAANAVLSNNRRQIEKHLWTENPQGDPVHMRELEDEHAEARFVAGEIERLVDSGTSRDEIAVFYRANAQSRVLEDTLVRYNVSYQVIGGTRFYERAEIKDAMAYLTLLVNPSDVVAFQRVVNSPRRGIGDTTQAKIINQANSLGESIWDVAADPEAIPGLGAAAIKAVRRFMSSMERLKEREESGADVDELLEELLSETGYVDALKAERTIESEGRLENLEELVGRRARVPADRRGAAPRRVPPADRPVQRAGQPHRRRGHRHADDAPQRQGARVPGRVHDRRRGGHLPAHALDRGGRPRRGEAALLRRHHARAAAAVHDLRAPAVAVRPALLQRAEPLPRRGARTSSPTARCATRGSRCRAGTAGGRARSRRAPSRKNAGATFSVGDDVEHATMGEGVVIGQEPGGLVVVRFALRRLRAQADDGLRPAEEGERR